MLLRSRQLPQAFLHRYKFFSVASRSSRKHLQIVEVGVRDGLQNEPEVVSTDTKLRLLKDLVQAGVTRIEATSFVSPKWVPQLADHAHLMELLAQCPEFSAGNGVRLSVLVPNMRGLELLCNVLDKLPAKMDVEASVFSACSDGFSKRNINKSASEGLECATEVARNALSAGLPVRGYLSTVVHCPYDGFTNPLTVQSQAEQLVDAGCYEVSLGDTTGAGTPLQIRELLSKVTSSVSSEKLALHAHDTYGQGVANAVEALNHGICTFDASVGGLGGCPYAKGAKGNVATEDLVYSFERMGFVTGLDLAKLSTVGDYITKSLNRPPSRAGAAILAAMT